MPKTRREYTGNAVETTITSSFAAAATSITIAAGTGWPATGPLYAVVDPGTATEEKIYIGAISGTSLSSITRGRDGTTAADHSSGAVIYPVFTAIDADEANELTSKYQSRGSIVYQGASTFQELTMTSVTAGHVLKAGNDDPEWGQIAAVGIASNAVIEAKIADGAVTTNKVADSAITTNKIGTTSVTTAKIADGAVTTAKIADANVTADKIATAVAGAGLAGGAGTALSVNVDASTIEIATDTLQVKDAGIGTAKIIDLNVTTGKLADGAVTTAKITDANVTTDKLANTAVTTAKIADDAVTADKIADNAVTSAQMADASVDLATATVTGSLPLANGGTGGTSALEAITNIKAYGKGTDAPAGFRITVAATAPASPGNGDIWIQP
jgi:hypothetical protein